MNLSSTRATCWTGSEPLPLIFGMGFNYLLVKLTCSLQLKLTFIFYPLPGTFVAQLHLLQMLYTSIKKHSVPLMKTVEMHMPKDQIHHIWTHCLTIVLKRCTDANSMTSVIIFCNFTVKGHTLWSNF